jgi:ataxia telangiectasia mutated family protein
VGTACYIEVRRFLKVWHHSLICDYSCTFQDAAITVDSSYWVTLWRVGTRALVLSNTCRAAALQLHAILTRRILLYRDVGEDISAIVISADVSGPVILCDSSIYLMMHILQTRTSEVPSASLSTSKHIIRWLFAKWDPGQYGYERLSITSPLY